MQKLSACASVYSQCIFVTEITDRDYNPAYATFETYHNYNVENVKHIGIIVTVIGHRAYSGELQKREDDLTRQSKTEELNHNNFELLNL